MESVDKDLPVLIISDCRRKTDLEYFTSHHNCILVRVTASEETREQRGFRFRKGVDDAESECDLDSFGGWNVEVTNEGQKDKLELDLGRLCQLISQKLHNLEDHVRREWTCLPQLGQQCQTPLSSRLNSLFQLFPFQQRLQQHFAVPPTPTVMSTTRHSQSSGIVTRSQGKFESSQRNLCQVVDVREVPEDKPIKSESSSLTSNSLHFRKRRSPSETPSPNGVPSCKKAKPLRKVLAEDAETNSPVSGMHIKEASEVSEDDLVKASELDETASCVHISTESREKIAQIPNVIGDSICSLCKVKFEDVFRLAMHRCPRIVHEEYRCPECEKVFSCPANLASHRRWHRPKTNELNQCERCAMTSETKKGLREHKCLQRADSLDGSLSDLSETSLLSPQPVLISLGLNSGSLTLC